MLYRLDSAKINRAWKLCEHELTSDAWIISEPQKETKKSNKSPKPRKAINSYSILNNYIFDITDEKVVKKLKDKNVKIKGDLNLDAMVFFGVANASHKHENASFCCSAPVLAELQQKWEANQHPLIKKSFSFMSYLVISVIRAAHLRPMDPNGKSDPYCELHLFDEQFSKLGASYYSQVRYETLNPTWGRQRFLIEVPAEARGVKLNVWDWDATSKDDLEGSPSIFF